MRQEKENQLYELLLPYENPNLPLTKGPMKVLNKKEIIEIYDFLISKPSKIEDIISREDIVCPVKDERHRNLARYEYKKRVADYISQWGYVIENPSTISISLLEAMANYFDGKSWKMY